MTLSDSYHQNSTEHLKLFTIESSSKIITAFKQGSKPEQLQHSRFSKQQTRAQISLMLEHINNLRVTAGFATTPQQ